MKMEMENSNNSPNIVGVKDWSMCRESIKDLLGPNDATYFLLNFYHKMPVPEFGLSSLSAKELVWHEREENVLARHSGNVLVHCWAGADAEFWNRLTCDLQKPVVITLELMENQEDRTHIKIMFSYGSRHSAFIFKLCPIIQDAYLMFFVPYQKFRDRHLSMLSSLHFLDEYMARMRCKTSSLTEFNQCIVCQKVADLVFLPCGHSTYCKKCSTRANDTRCPNCRLNVYERYIYRLPDAHRCLVCPARFGCHRMDCMLLPCRCVVGCKQYTQLAVQPGVDACPSCNMQPVDQLVKVFVHPFDY